MNQYGCFLPYHRTTLPLSCVQNGPGRTFVFILELNAEAKLSVLKQKARHKKTGADLHRFFRAVLNNYFLTTSFKNALA